MNILRLLPSPLTVVFSTVAMFGWLVSPALVQATGVSMPAPSKPTPDPTEEFDLLFDFIDHADSDIVPNEGADPLPDDYELGEYVPLYIASQGFSLGTITESLESELVESRGWLVPVMKGGVTISCLVVSAPGSASPWRTNGIESADLGLSIQSLGATDRVLSEPESGALYVVSGEAVGPLNEIAAQLLPVTVTLSVYQDQLVARYQPLRDLGEFAIGAGAGEGDGAPSEDLRHPPRSAGPVNGASLTVVLVVLLLALLVWRRS